MKASYTEYKYLDSNDRIDEILNSPDFNYEERNSIPSRDSLSYNKGFYVNCSAMFVDMRDSKSLADNYKRPTLARIYKSFISELVAVMKGHEKVKELNIEGDCVWGVYDTPKKADIQSLFIVSSRVAAMIDILNWQLQKKSLKEIEVGIGIDYGRVLMVKAGYKGSGIDEVVWMGDVVSDASKLCNYGKSTLWDKRIMVSDIFYNNLTDEQKKLMEKNTQRDCYHGDVVNSAVHDWLEEQKKRVNNPFSSILAPIPPLGPPSINPLASSASLRFLADALGKTDAKPAKPSLSLQDIRNALSSPLIKPVPKPFISQSIIDALKDIGNNT